MDKAYEEVKRTIMSDGHNLSTETLQLCLEALRIAKEIKHNGYTNYVTWLAAAYIDNDKNTYDFYDRLREDLHKIGEPEENAVGIIAQTMEMEFGAQAAKLENWTNNEIWSSVINDAKCSINYYEIAKNFYSS